MGIVVTIDGPSSTGKGYLAHEIAKKFNLIYIDTGAMYRAFGMYVLENNINLEDNNEVKKALDNVELKFKNMNEGTIHIFMNDEDVESKIRNEKIAHQASLVSSNVLVRQDMVRRQREYAKTDNIIMEGRDIGSVVIDKATLKIYLTADVNVRAKRRYEDLVKKGYTGTFEETLEDLKKRDYNDIHKTISPLIKTSDMIEIDNTYITREELVDKISSLLKERI